MARFKFSTRSNTKPGKIPSTVMLSEGHTLYPFVFDTETLVEKLVVVNGIKHSAGMGPRKRTSEEVVALLDNADPYVKQLAKNTFGYIPPEERKQQAEV